MSVFKKTKTFYVSAAMFDCIGSESDDTRPQISVSEVKKDESLNINVGYLPKCSSQCVLYYMHYKK